MSSFWGSLQIEPVFDTRLAESKNKYCRLLYKYKLNLDNIWTLLFKIKEQLSSGGVDADLISNLKKDIPDFNQTLSHVNQLNYTSTYTKALKIMRNRTPLNFIKELRLLFREDNEDYQKSSCWYLLKSVFDFDKVVPEYILNFYDRHFVGAGFKEIFPALGEHILLGDIVAYAFDTREVSNVISDISNPEIFDEISVSKHCSDVARVIEITSDQILTEFKFNPGSVFHKKIENVPLNSGRVLRFYRKSTQ